MTHNSTVQEELRHINKMYCISNQAQSERSVTHMKHVAECRLGVPAADVWNRFMSQGSITRSIFGSTTNVVNISRYSNCAH
jgi:hypothetical protein